MHRLNPPRGKSAGCQISNRWDWRQSKKNSTQYCALGHCPLPIARTVAAVAPDPRVRYCESVPVGHPRARRRLRSRPLCALGLATLHVVEIAARSCTAAAANNGGRAVGRALEEILEIHHQVAAAPVLSETPPLRA